jgi:hypothetical protein
MIILLKKKRIRLFSMGNRKILSTNKSFEKTRRFVDRMFPKDEPTRKHCLLAIAMFPKGGQTRKHCFLAMFAEG